MSGLETKIIIQQNLLKSGLLFVFVAAMLGVGAFFLVNDTSLSSTEAGVLWVCFGFMGLLCLMMLYSLVTRKLKIILDAKGLTYTSIYGTTIQVSWSDVTGARVMKVKSNKFILIDLQKPQQHIRALPTAFGRRGARNNYKLYGTPICISTTLLQRSHDEIMQALEQAYQHYKKTAFTH